MKLNFHLYNRMCHRYDGLLDVPGRCLRQTYRANISINNPEDFGELLYLMNNCPMLQWSLEGFLRWHNKLSRVNIMDVTTVAKTLMNSFKVDLPNRAGFTKELDRWKKRWAAAKLEKTTLFLPLLQRRLQPLRCVPQYRYNSSAAAGAASDHSDSRTCKLISQIHQNQPS